MSYFMFLELTYYMSYLLFLRMDMQYSIFYVCKNWHATCQNLRFLHVGKTYCMSHVMFLRNDMQNGVFCIYTLHAMHVLCFLRLACSMYVVFTFLFFLGGGLMIFMHSVYYASFGLACCMSYLIIVWIDMLHTISILLLRNGMLHVVSNVCKDWHAA